MPFERTARVSRTATRVATRRSKFPLSAHPRALAVAVGPSAFESSFSAAMTTMNITRELTFEDMSVHSPGAFRKGDAMRQMRTAPTASAFREALAERIGHERLPRTQIATWGELDTQSGRVGSLVRAGVRRSVRTDGGIHGSDLRMCCHPALGFVGMFPGVLPTELATSTFPGWALPALTAAMLPVASSPEEVGLAHATVLAVLYFPAVQTMHVVAAADVSVFVTEPALQSAHAVCDCGLNFPAAHTMQVCAPVLLSVLVTEPALQSAHAVCDCALNLPAAHTMQV